MKAFSTRTQISSFVFALFLLLTAWVNSTYAQEFQAANFSTGKEGTKSYEHFSFYVQNGKRADIGYAYGKAGRGGREIKLTYLGKDTLNGQSCFKVQFPNNQVLYIVPQKTYLKVVDEKGSYSKIFRWEYEGPVDGRGTWCEPCTQDDKESLDLIRKYFLK